MAREGNRIMHIRQLAKPLQENPSSLYSDTCRPSGAIRPPRDRWVTMGATMHTAMHASVTTRPGPHHHPFWRRRHGRNHSRLPIIPLLLLIRKLRYVFLTRTHVDGGGAAFHRVCCGRSDAYGQRIRVGAIARHVERFVAIGRCLSRRLLFILGHVDGNRLIVRII